MLLKKARILVLENRKEYCRRKPMTLERIICGLCKFSSSNNPYCSIPKRKSEPKPFPCNVANEKLNRREQNFMYIF
jgi:hypothetical protein